MSKNEKYAAYWRALMACRKTLREAPAPDQEAEQLLAAMQKEIERVSEWLDDDWWGVEDDKASIGIDLVALTRYAKETGRTAKELSADEVDMFRRK